jgi:hypothetical protein
MLQEGPIGIFYDVGFSMVNTEGLFFERENTMMNGWIASKID